MARKRTAKNRNLPANLYFENRPKGIYWYYRDPDLGRKTTWGYVSEAEARDAAIQLNAMICGGKDLVAATLAARQAKAQQNEGMTFVGYVQQYRREVLPKRRIKGHVLSQATLTEANRILDRISEGLGYEAENRPRVLVDVTQSMIAAYLSTLPTPEAHNKHRARLVHLYSHAVSDGLVPENLPEKIKKRDAEAKQRDRLTIEQYQAIFAQAEHAIQSAMELSLNTLQRRADIQAWHRDQQHDGFAYVVQSKTRKHGKSAYIRMPLSLPLVHSQRGLRTLDELIQSCWADGIVCPYLVHRKPKRVQKSKQKSHVFQLSPKEISEGFAEAREKTGLFKDIPIAQRPSFHEVISLGIFLREQSGWTLSQIKALKGHTSEKMTKVYQDGHDWTTVEIPAKTG